MGHGKRTLAGYWLICGHTIVCLPFTETSAPKWREYRSCNTGINLDTTYAPYPGHNYSPMTVYIIHVNLAVWPQHRVLFGAYGS